MKCVVNQCCCGCTLKTGSLSIGIVETILSGILLAILILAAAAFSEVQKGTIHGSHTTEEQMETLRNAASVLVILFSLLCVVAAVHMIFSILLACGASNENPRLIKPWIIYSMINVVLSVILYFTSAIIAFVNGQTTNGVQSLVSLIFGTALQVYFIIVVRSFHLELTQPGHIKNTA